MRKLSILFILVILSISASFAAQTKIKSLRISSTGDNTRLVFDVSSIPQHKIFQLKNPNRLVIDFSNAYLEKSLSQPNKSHPLLTGLRTAHRNKKDLRVVIDLQANVKPKSFVLQANKKYGPRIVVDLPVKNKTFVTKKTTYKSTKTFKTAIRSSKPFIVAVDAGHGGKDSGARGKRGTLEKKVVFQISTKLAALINKQPGMKAIMVRKGDYYVSLRQRMKIARKANADLFVSIHADAFTKSNVTGASVFTLSRRGATSEAARWLAKQENAADLIGGVSLDDKDDILASVLLDLSQTASQDISQLVANEVLKNFARIGDLHSHKVQKAGFMVLKSPDIPSILVETAFISNPKEERRLKSSKYQMKMAQAIKKGIMSYAKNHSVALNASLVTDESAHRISKGETLLGIALQYGITLDQLKRANTISRSNNIRVGQVLSIPVGI
ncbi:N-acetylmuramoyl-L-alanine amidase [Bathymodiolus platifrons methanotrophic gill symbiont]|uniref:N-acetylmuramoyl-L-alanine amidase n=1 Tax=Bathymodiolus platifrons methanotrophic gill symbiont TaxID=113268 RepID=UPI0011C8FD3B|nr:N-acetylmuramoyl-L-alanine amidase [Bathymodiolus platifrons methanotrophic gill symbiont]TXK99987.1 N-acetylmuramoyl-L-alanine amidase [Methylococcaceae bacterium HT1]TXL16075.1 N-acetylmuramoyl-L-alanine amidase [Methylococcaceae bacterium HT3]TXL21006.1 N-acetylmuramoyl-L-alanine amidase [Methylococcaceae bacterium HT2]GFO75437.1 N-acetylmuramoyl-L-alanine amidase [Bathymodiolus platifrons methanotrophic gill symbiont]